jgi:O-antigen biosynthesis protein
LFDYFVMESFGDPKMRIAIITEQIEGIYRNGGIGTANRHLAEHLSAAGHSVDVFHTGYIFAEEDWVPLSRVLNDLGIGFFAIHSDGRAGRPFQARQMSVYEALRNTEYDIYLFHDWLAHGLFCFLARETGVAFQNARLGLTLHSPQAWCDQANGKFPSSHEDVILYDMERACAERADFVTSPSQYMLDWVRDKGWRLPSDAFVIPNFISSPGAAPAAKLSSSVNASSLELCFFGRLEDRKGLPLFIDALKDLRSDQRGEVSITFLGVPCPYTPQNIREMLGESARDFRAISFQSDLDTFAARAYLRAPGRLAVMPSLIDNSPCTVQECIEEGIPFIASDRGGGKELIAAEDRKRITFTPTRHALVQLLSRVIAASGVELARPRWTAGDARQLWAKVLSGQRQKSEEESRPAESEKAMPLVSVILVHHDRPETLMHALASLQRQTYSNIEIVLVDDGSNRLEAQRLLDQVEREQVFSCPIRVIRQENRYLGAARNFGLRESKGDFVLFFDDDNVALPDMVQRYMAALQRTGADVVSGAMRYFYSPEGLPTAEDCNNQLCHFIGGASNLSGLFENHFGDASSLYRRSAVEKAGGFHEIYGVTHEDWKLFLDLQRIGARIVSIPEMQYWYRVTPQSMIRSTRYYDNLKASLSAYVQEISARLAGLPELLIGMHLDLKRLQSAGRLSVEQIHDDVSRVQTEFQEEKRQLQEERDQLAFELGLYRDSLAHREKLLLRVWKRILANCPLAFVQKVPRRFKDFHDHRLAHRMHNNIWFDANYYLAKNPDVAATNIDPWVHFCYFGWKERRSPCMSFDTAFYLKENPEVEAAGINPLLHFLIIGRARGNKPNGCNV